MYQLFSVRDINPQDRQALLSHFGIPDAPLFAQGTEAEVYELDNERLLKIYSTTYREGFGTLAEDKLYSPHFALPTILDVVAQNQCTGVVETRVPGIPLADVLPTLPDTEHDRIESLYLDTVWQIREIESRNYRTLALSPARLLVFDPQRKSTFFNRIKNNLELSFEVFYAEQLQLKAEATAPAFEQTLPDFRKKVAQLIKDLQSRRSKTFSYVHGDLFEGNIMVNETATKVLGVLDFSVFTLKHSNYLLDVAGAYGYYRMFDPDRDQIRARLLTKILARLSDEERPVFYQFLLGNAIMTCDLYAGDRALQDDGHFNWALEIVKNEDYWQGALG